MELISLLILIYAIKSAIEDTRSGWRTSKAAYMRSADARFPDAPKSRRAARALQHDTGYWAAQALRFFPAARRGFGAGWREGRQARAEGKPVPRQPPSLRRPVPGNDIDGKCLYCDAPDGKECKPDCPYGTGNWREVGRIDLKRLATREGREGTGEGSPGAAAPEPVPYYSFWRNAKDGTLPSDVDDVMTPEPADDGLPAEEEDPSRPTYSYGPATSVYGWPAGNDADKAHRQAQRMSTGKPWVVTEYPPGGGPGKTIATYLNGREVPADPPAAPRTPRVCVACGNPEGGKWGPLVIYDKPLYAGETVRPRLIHKAHFEDESSGFYGEPYKPAPPDPAYGMPSGPAQCDTSDAGRHENCNTPGCPCPCHATTTEGNPSMTSAAADPGPARITGSLAADPTMNDYIEAAYDLPPGEAARRAGNTVWSATTEGTSSMATAAADTTYDNQINILTQIRDDAEQEVASVRRKRMLNHLDVLSGLRLDSQTLSEAAAIDDALKRQEDAAKEALEAAETARGGLIKRHGDIQEAVDNSAAPLPAEPEFYAR